MKNLWNYITGKSSWNLWEAIKYYSGQTGLLLCMGIIIFISIAFALLFLMALTIALLLGWHLLGIIITLK